MGRTAKAALFWLVVIVSAVLLWQVVKANTNDQKIPEISYSEFFTRIANGEFSRVMIAGSQVRVVDTKGARFRVTVPASNQVAMLNALQEKGVEIWFSDAAEGNWSNWIMNLVPLVLLAALWFFMIRQMQTANRRLTKASSPPGPQQDTPARFGP